MNVPSVRLINADTKEAELRGKYSKYDAMEQTPEVVDAKRLIRRCIAELRDTPTYEGDQIVVVHRNEKVVRCPKCVHSERRAGGWVCRNPRGMLAIDDMSFCSWGVREA